MKIITTKQRVNINNNNAIKDIIKYAKHLLTNIYGINSALTDNSFTML